MTLRRDFLRNVARAIAFAPLLAAAQRTSVRRIGVLSPGPTLQPRQYQGVWTPLRDLGWKEGENLVFERRWAEGKPERLVPLAQELVGVGVEIIVTIGTEATVAARKATGTIPIIMVSAADPVGAGLVASLAHPGGNVTGISMVGPELEVKRIALLREIVPSVRRVGVLVDPTTAVSGYSRTASESALKALGAQPVFIEVASADGLEEAVAAAVDRGAQALIVHYDVLFVLNRVKLMSAVLRHRLPAIVEDRGMLDPGGLIAYSVDEDDQLKRFAAFVDRVLRGAKPADLPVEQPTKFMLAVNVRTATAFGLTIPPAMLLRADEVIR